VSSQRSALDQLKLAVGDLIERRDERSDLGDLRRYADDPLGFCRDILRVEPWFRQEEIARSVLAHRKTHVRGGVGLGKDAAAGWLALWWAYAREGLVLLTSATQRQVVEQMMRREIGGAFRRAKLPGELLTTGLRVGDETRMLAFTSSDAASHRGYHHPRTLVLISEAFGVEDFAWHGLLDCAVGPDDRVLAYGNPTAPTGPFYDKYRRPDWNKLRLSALEFPNVVEGRQIIPGGTSREWVEEQDPGSPFYAANVLGEFPETAINSLVTIAWLERAAALHAAGAFEGAAKRRPFVCGLDVARSFDGDASCLCVTQGSIVRAFHLWRERDSTVLRRRVEEQLRTLRIYPRPPDDLPPGMAPTWPDGVAPSGGRVVLDAHGLGGPVFDELRRDRWPVKDFSAARRARDPERFANARAEAYWQVRGLLERGELALPRDAALFEELQATTWAQNAKQQIQIVDKDAIRKTLGRSPDRLDALVMALLGTGRGSVSGLGFVGQW